MASEQEQPAQQGRMSRKWLRERLFGTWDRGLMTTSFLATAVASALGLFLVKYPQDVPTYLVIRDLLFWFALITLTLIFAVGYVRRETMIEEQQRLLSNPHESAHDIVHSFRDGLFERYHDPVFIRPTLTDADLDILNKLCGDITFHVRESLLRQFRARGVSIRDDVSVSVKLIVTPEEVIVVAKKLNKYKPEIERLRSKQD